MRITTYRLYLTDDLKNRIVKESAQNIPEITKISGPQDITDLMNRAFRLNQQAEEYLYLLCMNNKNKLIGVFELSHGSVNYTIMSTRSIFIRAVLCAAVKISLVHNHPGGDVNPSAEDIRITKRVREAGELLEITLVDHIIIGNGYYSFLENKRI